MFSWPRFVEKVFEQRTAVWKKPYAEPLVTEAAAFALTVAACNDARRRPDSPGVRFYLNGRSVRPSALMPREEDATFRGYEQRLARQKPGTTYGVVVNEYHRYDHTQWRRLREFLAPLQALRGIGPRGVIADIFCGNYRATPFGVHKDSQSVLTFVVSGKKRVLAWPFEVFVTPSQPANIRTAAHELDLHDYAAHRAQATVLEGDPGDVIYWPSSRWHIAESTGGTCVTAGIGFYVDAFADVMRDEGRSLLKGPPVVVDASGARGQRVRRGEQRMPPGLRRAIAHAQSEIDVAASLRWLGRMSNLGLGPPSLREETLQASDVVACDKRFPLVWLEGDSQLLIGAAGRGVIVRNHIEPIRRLCVRLNSGRPASVQALIDACGAPNAEKFLQLLFSYRALT